MKRTFEHAEGPAVADEGASVAAVVVVAAADNVDDDDLGSP